MSKAENKHQHQLEREFHQRHMTQRKINRDKKTGRIKDFDIKFSHDFDFDFNFDFDHDIKHKSDLGKKCKNKLNKKL